MASTSLHTAFIAKCDNGRTTASHKHRRALMLNTRNIEVKIAACPSMWPSCRNWERHSSSPYIVKSGGSYFALVLSFRQAYVWHEWQTGQAICVRCPRLLSGQLGAVLYVVFLHLRRNQKHKKCSLPLSASHMIIVVVQSKIFLFITTCLKIPKETDTKR